MKLVTIIFGVLFCGVLHASVLSTAAASMKAGEWKLLSTNGFGGGNIMVPLDQGCGSGDYITQYSESAAWDPINKRFMFYGATHGYCYAQRLIIYTESDNNWQVGPLHPGSCSGSSGCFSHGYDHSTVDPATGDFWYREYGEKILYKYSAAGGVWSTTSAVTDNIVRAGGTCCNAIEYFPEMKGVVFSAGNGGTGGGYSQLGFYNPATNQWSSLSGGLPVGSYNNLIEYNPVHKIMLFGGGSGSTKILYKLTASGTGAGTVTRLNDAPVNLAVTQCMLSVDPVSGKYLVLSSAGFYEYDIIADAWKKLSTAVPSILSSLGGYGDGLIESAVTTYGVIMYVKWSFSNSAVYLYKHTEGGGTAAEAVQRQAMASRMEVTPNPVRGRAVLRVPEGISGNEAHVALYSAAGKKVWSSRANTESLTDGMTMDASRLPAGLYLCRVQADGVSMVKKIIVEN